MGFEWTGDAFGGLIAGILGTVIGYPLDTVKTRMQTSSREGMALTARSIAQSEGMAGFYKGPVMILSIHICPSLKIV